MSTNKFYGDVSSGWPEQVEEVEHVDGQIETYFHAEDLLYRDVFFTNSEVKVTFSATEVRLSGQVPKTNGKLFRVALDIDDMTLIESQWSPDDQNQKAQVYITWSPGAEKLYIVASPTTNWHEKIVAILCMNNRYRDLWDVMLQYDDDFEEFDYTGGNGRTVTIKKEDVDVLKPYGLINGTIIDFYIMYLHNRLPSKERRRSHFFSCFFYPILLRYTDSSGNIICSDNEAFRHVRLWTNDVDLFDKDFIFIPINSGNHWSLIVIFYPGEITDVGDKDVEKSARGPCIVHMDSWRRTHKSLDLKNLMRSYLCELWKNMHKGEASDTTSSIAIKFLKMKFVYAEVPQQQNYYDCGLYLLHYVEKVLEEKSKTKESKDFLTERWFSTCEPSLKRVDIHRAIDDLRKRRSQTSQ